MDGKDGASSQPGSARLQWLAPVGSPPACEGPRRWPTKMGRRAIKERHPPGGRRGPHSFIHGQDHSTWVAVLGRLGRELGTGNTAPFGPDQARGEGGERPPTSAWSAGPVLVPGIDCPLPRGAPAIFDYYSGCSLYMPAPLVSLPFFNLSHPLGSGSGSRKKIHHLSLSSFSSNTYTHTHTPSLPLRCVFLFLCVLSSAPPTPGAQILEILKRLVAGSNIFPKQTNAENHQEISPPPTACCSTR